MINLYIEYFQSKNIERKQEIISSIEKNISFNFIDNFYIFASNFNWLYSKDQRIHTIQITDRCTFGYIFDFANLVSQKDDINILINNDIILTENFVNINIDDNTYYCISRFENEKDKFPHCAKYGGSQDTWVWKGKNMIPIDKANFYMGIPACDHIVAYEASLVYSEVKNPSYRYRTIHNHKSNIRTYDEKNKIIDRSYKFIKPHQ